MPTYSYQCKECHHILDVFHGIRARPRVKCDKCGGSCKRLLGRGAGIIFKGSGFYETDYRGKDGKGKDRSEKPAKDKAASEPKASDSISASKDSGSSGMA